MFSATYSDDIRRLAENLLRNPLSVEVNPPQHSTADKVEQVSYRLPKDHKRHLLAHLIKEGNWHQVLVFTRTKHGANRLAEQLQRAGIPALPIHGNKSQNARVRALEDFKDNRIIALVATEVAARGLDIKELPYVVNYELPNVPEDYVHRIGRTARAGSTGKAISLVSPDEAPYLKDIVSLLGTDVPSHAAAAVRDPRFGARRAARSRGGTTAAIRAASGGSAGQQRQGQPAGHLIGRVQRPGGTAERRAQRSPQARRG